MTQQTPYNDEIQPFSSPIMRWLLIAIGTIMTGLGLLGVFLPVLPTTPFLLLAAYCYARSSRRLYEWLLNRPGVGPLIRQYREHRVIPVYAKVMAVSMITVTIGLSAWLAVPLMSVKIGMIIIGLSVSIWLCAHPSELPDDTDSNDATPDDTAPSVRNHGEHDSEKS